MSHLAAGIKLWYATAEDTFSDADSSYQRLVGAIEGFVSSTNKAHPKRPTLCLWTYTRDSVILNCRHTLAVYQQLWQCNPNDRDARDAMVSVARHLNELRLLSRRQYWQDFWGDVRKTPTLRGM